MGTWTGEPELRAQPLRRRVAANQRANTAAVDPRDLTEVHQEIVVSIAQERLDALLELLRRTAGDEPLLRRQYDPAADCVLRDCHVTRMTEILAFRQPT